MATHKQISQQIEQMLKTLDEQRKLSWMASEGYKNIQYKLVGGVQWFDCSSCDDVKYSADSIIYREKP